MSDTFKAGDGKGYRWIDADTFVGEDGQSYRVNGYDAREAAKLTEEGLDPGERGQEKQAAAISDIQHTGGFYNIVDSKETDKYGRKLVNLHDDNNQDFSEKLWQSGAVEADTFTSEAHTLAKQEGDLERELLGGKPSFEVDDYLKFKSNALTEREFDERIHSGVQFRDYDRTIDNQARSSVGAAWEAGWNNVQAGLYGAAELIGNGIGYEGMERYGALGVADVQRDTQDIPQFIQDYKQVYKEGAPGESVLNGLQYVLNNAVMSAPYMAILLGSSVFGGVGAAAGTGTLALTHAGNTWNDIEGEKGGREAVASLVAGVAMSTLERIGLSAVMKPSSFVSANGTKIATKKLAERMARKNGVAVTKEIEAAAAAQINQALTSNSTGLLRQLASVRPEDIAALGYGREAAKQAARGFVGEATTEGLQEGLQYGVSTGLSEGGWDENFKGSEITSNLVNAILAGGSIGGSIGSAGGVRRAHESRIFQSDLEKGNVDKLNGMERLRQNHLTEGRYINTVEENLVETRNNRRAHEAVSEDVVAGSTANLAKQHQEKARGIKNVLGSIDDIPDAISTVFGGIQKLYQGAEKQAVPLAKAEQSPILRDILGRIGQNAYSVYHSGQNFVNYQDSIMGDIKSKIDEVRVLRRLGHSGVVPLTRKKYRQVSNELRELGNSDAYATLKEVAEGNKTYDDVRKALPENLQNKTDEEIGDLFAAANEFEAAYNQIFDIYAREHQKKTGSVFPGRDKFWANQTEFSADKVRKNPDGFKKFLRQNTNMLDTEIEAMYDNVVLGGNLDNSNRDADFSYLNGKDIVPHTFKPVDEQLSTKDGYNDFAEEDIFAILDKRSREAARYKASNEYFGPGGQDLDFMFSQLANEGVLSEDEIARTAWYTKAIIDSSQGNFNRIQNKNVQAAQQFLVTWSHLSGLGLSALSSFPETFMIMNGLRDNLQVKTAVHNATEEFKGMFASAQTDASKRLDKIGLKTDRVSVASRLAAGEINPAYLWAQDAFFRVTGIKAITDFQRRANAAMATDFVADNLDIVKDIELLDNGKLNLASMNSVELDAYNQLSNLGMQPDKMVDYWRRADMTVRQSLLDTLETDRTVDQYNKEDGEIAFIMNPTGREVAFRNLVDNKEGANLQEVREQAADIRDFFDEQMDTATYRFVNERVQNPQAANRPLFFQDPRYILLTQFNGFLSTYTSVVFPKLWNDTIKNGAPRARYQAAQMVIAMVAMGGASQWLKDMLKYGEPSPHLDNWGYAQRAINSSGALGQAEKLTEIIAPLYQSRHETSADRVIDLISGRESPAFRNVSGVVGGVTDIARGDVDRGVNSITRTVPVASNLPGVRGVLNDLLTGQVPKIGQGE